jgi:carbamoyl-phosphate synthase large subunit
VRILAGDLNPGLSAACALADASFKLPPVSDPAYAESVVDICRSEGVALVVPTIDPELPPLAQASEALAAVGTRINISSSRVVGIAADKFLTAEVLAAGGVHVPRTSRLLDWLEGRSQIDCPVIAKPRKGSSSVGLHILESKADAKRLADPEDYVVQERLRGPEYTVNVFVDQAGVLRAAVPHRRLEVRGGEVSKARTERQASIAVEASAIAAALDGMRGALCFQLIMTDAGPAVFEINARFGGGYPVAHAAGARFSQWLLEESLGAPSTAADDWKDGVQMLRYDAEVFI